MTARQNAHRRQAVAPAGAWASASPWPGARELWLLRAALLEGDAALAAWRRFCATGPGLDQLSYDEYRVLPVLSRKLRALDPDDSALGLLKGVYRHAWYANQQMMHAAATAIASLRDGEVEVMLLKGAAIVAGYRLDIGVRPMDDIDILVRPADALRSVEILAQGGWAPRGRHSLAQLMRIHHAISLTGPRHGAVDLHWTSLTPRSNDAHLWDDRVPVALQGVQTWAPGPTDQLVLACAHGLGWNAAPARWIIDAMLILRASADAIDWQAVVARARSRRVTLDVAAALAFLGGEFSAPVPDGLVGELRRCPVTTRERLLHHIKMDPLRRAPLWRFVWRLARRADAAQRLALMPPIAGGQPNGVLDMLQEDWILATRRATVVRMAREGLGWVRQSAA